MTSTDVPAPGRRERIQRLGPFAGVTLLAVALGWLPPERPHSLPWMTAGAFLAVFVIAMIVALPWPKLPSWAPLVPVTMFCTSIDFLRAAGGGNNAGYGPLLLLPVIWQALYGRRRNLYLTLGSVITANIVAVVVLPSSSSAVALWRGVILYSVVAIVMGESIRRLVMERRDLLDQVTSLALHDQLTGLPNRRMWDERFPIAVASAARTGAPLTVALLDLDHFKAYNDRYGHPRGDALLHSVAEAWRRSLRPDDLLVRWGGEEFALLLPATDPVAAMLVLERLQQAMPESQTFSAGFSTESFRPDAVPDSDRLLEGADVALYAAKDRGRGRAISTQALTRELAALAREDGSTDRRVRIS